MGRLKCTICGYDGTTPPKEGYPAFGLLQDAPVYRKLRRFDGDVAVFDDKREVGDEYEEYVDVECGNCLNNFRPPGTAEWTIE